MTSRGGPLDDILQKLSSGSIGVDEARKRINLHSIDRIQEMAKLDAGRQNRSGAPEVVYAESKELRDTLSIMSRIVAASGSAVVSRIRPEHMDEAVSHARTLGRVETGLRCSTIHVRSGEPPSLRGTVGVLAAGTSDVGVAEEARLMAGAMGCACLTAYDVGVAGLHRLLPELRKFVEGGASAVVAAAGMEGALATVTASLVDVPVIGVPVSVGYGHGGRGEAALSSMLQSCSLGLAVVNIDNGIGAGALAASIARSAA